MTLHFAKCARPSRSCRTSVWARRVPPAAYSRAQADSLGAICAIDGVLARPRTSRLSAAPSGGEGRRAGAIRACRTFGGWHLRPQLRPPVPAARRRCGAARLDAPQQYTKIAGWPRFYEMFRRVSAVLPSLSRFGISRVISESSFGDLPEPARDQERAFLSIRSGPAHRLLASGLCPRRLPQSRLSSEPLKADI